MKKLTPEIDHAIRSVFSNPEIGYNALGVSSDEVDRQLGFEREKDVSAKIDPLVRISLLRRRLEEWVLLKGREIQYYAEGEDTIRIEYEMITTLLVLRDISQFFPEVNTASKEDYDALLKML